MFYELSDNQTLYTERHTPWGFIRVEVGEVKAGDIVRAGNELAVLVVSELISEVQTFYRAIIMHKQQLSNVVAEDITELLDELGRQHHTCFLFNVDGEAMELVDE